MHVGRILLSLLLLLLAPGPLAAEQPLLPGETAAALAGLQARRFELGLEARDDFRVLGAHRDDLGQSHVRFQQLCEGVPVFGGEAISHTGPGGEALPLTDALRRGVRLAVQPTLTAAEALVLADADLRPAGPYAHPPTAERVIWPVPSGAPGYLLAYHVHTQLENGSAETRHTDYLFDAHSGALLKRWDSLRSEAAKGDGLTQYSGTVKLDLDCTGKGYELRDRTRGKGGEFGSNVITNLDHGSEGKGAVCFNAGSSWGDHANYTGDTLPTAGPPTGGCTTAPRTTTPSGTMPASA